jgi:hypothetical protein
MIVRSGLQLAKLLGETVKFGLTGSVRVSYCLGQEVSFELEFWQVERVKE